VVGQSKGLANHPLTPKVLLPSMGVVIVGRIYLTF